MSVMITQKPCDGLKPKALKAILKRMEANRKLVLRGGKGLLQKDMDTMSGLLGQQVIEQGG